MLTYRVGERVKVRIVFAFPLFCVFVDFLSEYGGEIHQKLMIAVQFGGGFQLT